MAPETVGRKLGIGLRLAARAVQQRAAGATAASRAPGRAPADRASYERRSAYSGAAESSTKPGKAVQGVARGVKRFGEALWGPLAHTGGVLWLEITGLFFALFAAFFGQNVYKFRHDYAGGPERAHFLVYTALTLVFAWFTFSSFLKARRKEKKNRLRRVTQKG